MDIVFKAINDPTRREILRFLTHGPQNAGTIAQQFNMSKPSISHHLDLLKQAQLVDFSKKGQFLVYTLNKSGFESIHAWFQPFTLFFELPKPKIRL
ncbi:autorepressor SdpR family transcription factor [Aquirufa salirivi]|uniref:Autorepressor SdpR family transcription factor n=1 Tax=Aquirufa salirivi TaxID=3104729 RepID=A0ABW8RVK3_9BACT